MKLKSLVLALVLTTSLVAKDKLKVYFEGGAAGDSFSTVITNGAKMAAHDMDVDLKIYYSDWDPNKMIENFRNALATKPDGMVIMGHPGDELYKPLVKKAYESGIVVSAVDTELPKTKEEFASLGFGYTGSNNYKSGISMAHEAIRKFGLTNKDTVMIWGLLSQPIRGLRAKGMKEVFEKNGIKVDYIEISPEINKDPSLGLSVFSAYASKNPNTRLAIMDHGALTAQIPQFMKNLKINKDKLQIAGFSLSPATVSGIKEGYIDLVGDAQPFVQGYLGVWQVVMSKKFAFSGFEIDTGGGFATIDNIKTIEPLIKNGIR